VTTAATTSRRIFITGVGRGLGLTLAQRFAANGDIVFGSARGALPDSGLAGLVMMDLSDEESVLRAARELADQTDSLDLLINCAGADARAFGAGEDDRGIFDLDAATFNAVFNVNATGPMVLTAAVLPLLRRGSDAMVVNVSSQLGSMQVAARQGRDAAYCVSKAALNMVSVKSAAALAPEGIGVVMLHPGWVQTDMGGENAPLTVEQSADAIVASINNLSFADSGRFIRWDGHDHLW
jgi:NAD(P)-dependent dehydrogenase (short-subunit alcohol dehydrogenase family)